MFIYSLYLLIVLLQSVVLSMIFNNNDKLYRKIFMGLSCLELIILVSLRFYTVGADTFTYVSGLQTYSELSFEQLLDVEEIVPYKFDFGYLWFTKLCAMVNMDYNIFLLLVAILIYVPLFRLIYRYSPFPLLSVVLYFGMGLFAYSLGIFRQFIAIAIIILGVQFIINQNFLKWILIVYLASLFHKSAFLCVPLFFIHNLNFLVLSVVSILFQLVFLMFGRDILELIFSMIDYYKGYIGSGYDKSGGSYISLFIYEIMLFVGIVHYKLKRSYRELRFVYNCIPIICCLQVLGYQFNLFGRTIPYYSIFLVLYIPLVLKDMFNPKQMCIASVLILIIGIMLFVKDIYNNQYITPFVFFWQQ